MSEQTVNNKEDNMNEAAAMRPKYWDELSLEEKVERMREVVKNLQYNVGLLDRGVGNLDRHSHAQDGTVLIPLEGALRGDNRPRRPTNDGQQHF